jgi:thioredoxin 1
VSPDKQRPSNKLDTSIMQIRTAVLALVALCLGSAHAFMHASSFTASTQALRQCSRSSAAAGPRMAVLEIGSEEDLDKTLAEAAGSLVVVDYSTTWCGPCKVIYPKFEEMSNKYTNAVFLKVSVYQQQQLASNSRCVS